MDILQHYINGSWVTAIGTDKQAIINPATEEIVGTLTLATEDEVGQAIAAAHQTFNRFCETTKEERLSLLTAILEAYRARYDDFVAAITTEMGAPHSISKNEQAYTGIEHFEATIKALKDMPFEQGYEGYRLSYQAVGVCGLIVPWNWPINQIACKVAPALAAGCTMVLKACEFSPISSQLFAEVMHEAGVPAGAFNMIQGDGTAGAQLSAHPLVDMISFTGSTRAGAAVAVAAAPTVKRVSQELGGKSPIVVMADVDIEAQIEDILMLCMHNSGQSCNNGTRLLLHENLKAVAYPALKKAAEAMVVGDPLKKETFIGPLANERNYQKVTSMIQQAMAEGYQPLTGGPDRPAGLNKGYYVAPTIFVDMPADNVLVKEEIFGPVLTVQSFKSEDEALAMANDTPYGLSAYVFSRDEACAARLARGLRSGMVHINGAPLNPDAPFGGFKQSGNGREWGVHGIHEFLEVKAIMA